MRRYPEYKESGVEWIGEIPAHWEMIHTKYLFRLVTEPAPQNHDYELLSIYTDIGVRPRKELEERGNRATTTDGYWLVKKGDFIVNKLLAWMGAIGLSDYEGVTSPAYDILRKIQPLNERFYEYLFRCGLYFTEFKKWSKGIMEVRLRLYFNQFGQIPLVFPPVDDQNKIVDFLDRKTGQIDELIRIKERQIELLHEKRTVLINQTVTKGLDPNVEMKSSGVEWIGEIPKHWNLSMLKYTARLVYGDTLISENRENGVVPVYGSNGIIDTHSSANTLSPTIIVGRKGSLGKVQYSDVPCFVIDTAYFIDKRASRANLRWLYYVLQAIKLERFRDSVIPGLKREHTESQYIPLITEEEQTQIANFLNHKTKQIDELIATEQRKIELLKEYRQSLISETVTGKIEVQNRA